MAKTYQVQPETKKVLILALQVQEDSGEEVLSSIEELKELLKTAGYKDVGTMVQKRTKESRAFYFGTGKVEEARLLAEELEVDLIAVDDELTPIQKKCLERDTGFSVVDRTSIILEIFAKHASTREGKLQVELARTQYNLIHLAGNYSGMSRQGGGIGAKGTGETQIESDRRAIKLKLKKLREELEKVVQDRETQGKKRNERYIPLFSLVGYTNAGKSTLLNRIAGSKVDICDGVFTTLDPTARKVELKSGRWCVFSDTVGFIRKLPHGLVKAFRATLESVVQSEVLLIVCDVSDKEFKSKLASVEEVLGKIGAKDHERIYVFNKIDKGLCLPEVELQTLYPNSIFISAAKGDYIDDFLQKIDSVIARRYRKLQIEIPSNSQLVKEVMGIGIVLSQEWGHGKVKIVAEVPEKLVARLKDYIIDEG